MKIFRVVPKSRNRNGARVERVESLERRCLLAAITVNTAVDATNLSTTLSLRQAIEISNGVLAVGSLTPTQQALVSGAVSSSNTIDFDIPTTDPGFNAATGVWTIQPTSALPTIVTNAAIIDGYSQPGASRNTLAQAENAVLKVAISGTGLGTVPGLMINSASSEVSGLDIKNFLNDGIEITANGVQVAGCFVGTDPTGEVAAPNATGVMIQGSSNTIGGVNLGDRNVISGNSAPGEGDGIDVGASGGTLYANNVIEVNFIGIDAAGTTALANGQAGVADFGTNNTYGGTTAGLGNVISGNAGDGIKSDSSITIEGNFIGTDATGNVALGNGPGGAGIDSSAFPSTQVITTTITNNLISGNKQGGIGIGAGVQATSVYTISNNKIGTNAAGTAALGNVGTGLELESVENTTVDDNLISANTVGISVSGFGTDVEHNVFQGNRIGTDTTGTLNLGNVDDGINFGNAVGNLIGGTGAGQANVIAFNGSYGIELISSGSGTASKQIQITENSIFGNTSRGIYLSPGGTNNFVMPPTLTFTPGSGGFGTLSGALTGLTPGDAYVVEIFSSPTVPAVGVEQGKTFVISKTVTATGTTGSFSLTEPTGVYTATTTDPIGDTSAFSHAAGAPALPATTTSLASSLNPSTVGQPVTFTAVVTAAGSPGTPTGTVTFTIGGVAQTPVPLAVVGGVDEAQLTTSTLTVGPHPVAATYSGDASFSPSNGTLPSQTVNPTTLLPTSTAVASSLNPSTVGQPVTFTAVVTAAGSPGTPTGTVTFTIGGVAQTPVPLAVVGGVDEAQLTTSTLTVGPHPVAATYSGDASFSPSVAALLTQTVDAARLHPTTTAVASSSDPSTVGHSVTFTAVVSPVMFVGTPSGTVTFTIDGLAESPVPVSSVGGMDLARFTTSALAVGQHSVAATYSGDSAFVTSTGNLPTQTVNAAALVATSTILTTSPNPSISGRQVVLTARVTSTDGTAIGGTVAFVEGTTILGIGVVGGGGLAMDVDASLPVGSNPILAVYSGDAIHSRSISDSVAQVVEPPSTVAPTVLSLLRYGYHTQPTTLVLGFSPALDAISAQDVRNYQIELLDKHGRPLKGRSIAILEAIYDPNTSSITLIPAQRLNIHYRYRLTVNGTTQNGVRGVSGLLIDGKKNGKPGSNYVAEINRKTLAGPAPGFAEPPKAAAVVRGKHVSLPSKTAVDRLAASGELETLVNRKRRLHSRG